MPGVEERVTICEFGVATGDGLLAMVDLAALGSEIGVEYRIVGFDTGAGLPPIGGYEDHPELWSPGDFAMVNKEQLAERLGEPRRALPRRYQRRTVPGFVASLSADAPLGFIAVDVDIYSATCSALRSLDSEGRALSAGNKHVFRRCDIFSSLIGGAASYVQLRSSIEITSFARSTMTEACFVGRSTRPHCGTLSCTSHTSSTIKFTHSPPIASR